MGKETVPGKQKKAASATKRPTKKKPKDKPKRPLSAYNYFFKEEREKILRTLLGEDVDGNSKEGNPDHIDDEQEKRLKKEGGKVSFEEMGKLIGQRWKAINPERLAKYTALAASDTERYKKEMEIYNGRREERLREEPVWGDGRADHMYPPHHMQGRGPMPPGVMGPHGTRYAGDMSSGSGTGPVSMYQPSSAFGNPAQMGAVGANGGYLPYQIDQSGSGNAGYPTNPIGQMAMGGYQHQYGAYSQMEGSGGSVAAQQYANLGQTGGNGTSTMYRSGGSHGTVGNGHSSSFHNGASYAGSSSNQSASNEYNQSPVDGRSGSQYQYQNQPEAGSNGSYQSYPPHQAYNSESQNNQTW